MNVLIVPSWYPTEFNKISGSFFKEQAEALAKKNINVTVFAINPIDIKTILNHPIKCKLFRIQNYFDNDVNTFQINIPTFGLNRINMFDYIYVFLFRLYYKILKNKIGNIDIIHAHSFKFAGYTICKLFSKHKKIITEHTSLIITNKLSNKDLKCLKYVVENANLFIAVSNSLKNKILEVLNIKKNILVIPNIVNNIFNYKKKINTNINFEFVSVSNLVFGKRVDILIKSFAVAFNMNNNVVLKIAGDGLERKKLESLIKQLNLEKKVFLLGQLNRENVLNLYQNADAFIMVSAYETFGIVYAESLMCGLPTIGTKNGGAEDILNCYGGYLCNVDDIDNIANSMKYVYNNYNDINRKKIYLETYEKFSEEKVINQIINLYNEILG